MTRTDRSVLRQFVLSDTQRLISGVKPNQRLHFSERPSNRSSWVCQSTAANLLEAGRIERESPGVYVITMGGRVEYLQDLTAKLRSREQALRR